MRPAALKSPKRRQSAAALILVVWIVTLLLALSGSFLYATRTDVSAARNAALMARAEAIALAALSRALIEVQKPPNHNGAWRRSPQPREWRFEDVTVRVTLSDESGKIDLNYANDALILSALRAAGLGEDQAARVLDAILDWRDLDSARRPNGAEERDYVESGLVGRPANQLFQSLEELQLVLGVSPEVFRRIAPMMTVYSRLPGINPHQASRSVLLALPKVTEEQVDAYIGQRNAAFVDGIVPPPFPSAVAFASYAPVSAVTVIVDVVLPGGLALGREAVALLTPQFVRRPYTLLSWREKRPLADHPQHEASLGR